MMFQKRNFWDYETAREFVRGLNLKSSYDYKSYVKGEKSELPLLPDRLPKSPDYYYKSTGDWINWKDFLGESNAVNSGIGVMSYEEAREFAQSLELDSYRQWQQYVDGEFPKLPKLPKTLPKSAGVYYKKRGVWKGWGDFLGTGNKGYSKAKYLSYNEARKFARTLRLYSRKEWEEYAVGGHPHLPPKPEDIPIYASRSYKKNGTWVSWEDFLGCEMLSFSLAKEFVHQLRLKNLRQWKKYTQGELTDLPPLPKAIPNAPQLHYEEWTNWGEWLGSNRVSYGDQKKWGFEHARRYVHTLGIQSVKEWQLYCKGKLPGTDLKPPEIPSSPASYYKEQWSGYSDWLGNGKGKGKHTVILPYEEALEFARSLGLNSKGEWKEYVNGNNPRLPSLKKGIPKYPYNAYRFEGWEGWDIWLGIEKDSSETK